MDFDEVIDRSGSDSFKWRKYAGQDVIPMWVADMDFRSPPAVIDALNARVAHGIFGYGVPPRELPGVIAETLVREYDWQIDPAWLVWLPGLVTGINVACRAIGRERDAVTTLTPIYPPFLSAPGNQRRKCIPVPMVRSRGWEMDFDALEAAFTGDTKLFLFCSPHNPTARAFTREELIQVGQLAARHGVVICSDEIHCGLVLTEERKHIPTASLSPEIADNTITLMAPSKTYNIPGLGCSFAVISNDSLRRRFKAAMAGIVSHVNIMGFAACLAAYRDSGDWHREVIEYLRGNRDLVMNEIGEAFSIAPIEATYLAWLDTGDIKEPAKVFEKAGVGVMDGAAFKGEGFVRMNFACPRPSLTQALERIRDITL